MNNLVFHQTPLAGVCIVERKPKKDSRGFLERLFCDQQFSKLTQGKQIKQINRTITNREGSVRGLHYQHVPYAETKIVLCLKGKVWDVAVDLRYGSPTFLRYHAQVLSEDNHLSYLIPEGVAHGFQTLAPDCEMLYFHTAEYNSDFDAAVNVFDPRVAIKWPRPISELSVRDASHPMLTDSFSGIKV